MWRNALQLLYMKDVINRHTCTRVTGAIFGFDIYVLYFLLEEQTILTVTHATKHAEHTVNHSINCLNTFRPRQDGWHFPDDIFKCIFWNENAWNVFTISLNFVPKGPINTIPSSVQIMAWRRSGDKPFSGPMMALFTDACMCHSASMN